MELLPSFRFGILNGWLYLAAYFLGLIITVLTFSPQKRKKLFSEPQYPRGSPRWFILVVGRLSAILFVVLSVFAELKLGTGVFYTGKALYALGYLLVLVSLVEFKRTPENKMVTDGLYRYSRNPQWLGLVLVFVGTAFAVGGGLHLILNLILIIAYHFQILLEEQVCEALYGESYQIYKQKVPRYFLFW